MTGAVDRTSRGCLAICWICNVASAASNSPWSTRRSIPTTAKWWVIILSNANVIKQTSLVDQIYNVRSTTFVCNSVAFVQLNDDDGSGEISGPVCSNASPNERVFMGRSCPFFPPISYDALESWDDRETSWLLCVPVLFSSRLEWTTASSTQTIFLSPVVFIARLKGELDEIRRTKWKEQFSFIFFIFILLWSFLLSSYSHFSPICTVTVVFDRTQEKKNTRRIVQLQARNKIIFFCGKGATKFVLKRNTR